ncbi:MAG: HlyD family efflux transporter periplasmic adaptor subunit [Pirellulaceae bacterium]|mgnify:CR=1 FL=1|nr:HlyD family efflux transporter periplasmic adaptor subunit [Pirellulaceae bacterium]
MTSDKKRNTLHITRWLIAILVLTAVAGAAAWNRWLPEARRLIESARDGSDRDKCAQNFEGRDEREVDHAAAGKTDSHDHETPGSDEHADERDGEHDEGERGHDHDESGAVRLTKAAQANVGVRLEKVERKTFERTISVPAMAVERPGRSHIRVAAPMTGVVSRIYPLQDEAVEPGRPLFDLRLTHEEIVDAQADLLQTVEELDVVQREIDRLEEIVASGAVAGKTMLEREYEKRKLEAAIRSQRQRLLLHGLTPEQIDGIINSRTLLGGVTVYVPSRGESGPNAPAAMFFQVEELNVDPGQHVQVGDPLCVLADYSELFIQGKAFERDAPALERAANRNWDLSAVSDGDEGRGQTVAGLKIFSLANRVDPASRAFLFHVRLPNELIRDRRTEDGRRFCSWQFKPGQRMELLVPVERWAERIVLPRDAVVQDGAESYVFEKNDGHFDRRAVRVEYRGQYSVVLADDGAIRPGATVAVAGAYQIHLALKQQSSAPADPHAGHNH